MTKISSSLGVQGLYIATVFISAFLLFWIQPLTSFEITPVFGGTPNVWNTLLLFFQIGLLLAYLYSHVLFQHLKPMMASTIHISLLAIAVWFVTQIEFGTIDGNITEHPALSVLIYAFSMIGLPYFMVATTAPLLQYIYPTSSSGQQPPYWLYAISNAGSLLALVSFPFLLQPLMTSDAQLMLWRELFIVFALMGCLVTSLKAFKHKNYQDHLSSPQPKTTISLQEKMLWALMAFIPSSLLHSVGVVIANDISSIPLLWVIPLSLYLLTFMIAFSGYKALRQTYWLLLVVLALLPVLILPIWVSPVESLAMLAAHIILFFILSLGCHYYLYQRRPDKAHLTRFYLWVALGGALGGFFNVIIAPVLFDKIYEYPLSIMLGFVVICFFNNKERGFVSKKAIGYCLLLLVLCSAFIGIYIYRQVIYDFLDIRYIVSILASILAALSLILVRNHILPAGLSILILFSLTGWRANGNIYSYDAFAALSDKEITIERNYFGIIKIVTEALSERYVHKSYYNGFVLHGYELFDKKDQKLIMEEATYHLPIIENARKLGKPYASLGLGTGSDLCYMNDDEALDIYEINQELIEWAQNPDYLYSLSTCEGIYNIIEGDARQELDNVPDDYYGGIISTISSSSTVPFHLLTKEAFSLYLQKLSPGGALVFMTPANFFDFTPLMKAYEDIFEMPVYVYNRSNEEGHGFRYFLFLKPPLTLEALNDTQGFWSQMPPIDPVKKVWHDSYYNIWDVLK